MKRQLTIFTFLFAITLISQYVYSQSSADTTLVRVKTAQGNEFIGTIVSEDADLLVLKTESLGEIRILKKDITLLQPIDNTKFIGGVYWGENPQATRYFWTPNGYGLKQGEGYYQNIWVLYNQVSYGFTKYFSMSAGMIPSFLFDAGFTPIWVVPKFSIPVESEKVNLSAGAFMGTVIGRNADSSGFGIVFGTATFGNRDRNSNFGLGYGYGEGQWTKSPILNASFMRRTGPKGYFISENYAYFGKDVWFMLLSLGGRRMIKNVGLDFALYIPLGTDIDGLYAAPFLGITVPFGDY